MTKRRKLFQYAQTSAKSQQAAIAAPAPSSTRPRPGPGPKGNLSSHPTDQGQFSQHPAPGEGGRFSAHPRDGGSGEIPFDPDNPQLRLLYPEYFGEPGEIVNSPHCYLPNNDPNAVPTVDRGRPPSAYEKSVRLGFQPQPNTLGFMAPGDAAAGQTQFRRAQLFARMDDPVSSSVAGVPFSQSIGLATQRASDQRQRIWHVSVFGIGQYRFNGAVAQAPLTESQIIGDGFIGNTGAGLGSSALPYVPRITNFKARAMIHDESGQRFYDFDVIGTRSFDVFAFGVTIFVLMPVGGYQVDFQNSAGNTSFLGLVQDAIVGARVMPVSFESSNRRNQRTETVAITSGGGGTVTQVPIPPGARTVQIINHGRTNTSADYTIDFDAGAPIGSAVASGLGAIILNAATFRTEVPIEIPNATAIRFTEGGGATSTAFSLIYEIDP